MCITSLEALLADTIVGVWDIDHPEYGYRHVLAYQNVAKNLGDGPNCMLLHIPTYEPLTEACMINTENDKTFLANMYKDADFSKGVFGARSISIVQMGIYDIALLNEPSAEHLEQALSMIPAEKRPEIRPEFMSFFQETFPGFPLVLCCFNNEDIKAASPVMVHFEPAFPQTFMFNTLDSHGSIPVLGEEVPFHQKIVVGSQRVTEQFGTYATFKHEGVSEALLPFLPKFGFSTCFYSEKIPNSDILIDNAEMVTNDHLEMDFGIITQA